MGQEKRGWARGGTVALLGLGVGLVLAGCGSEAQSEAGPPGAASAFAMGGVAERPIPVAVEVVGASDLQVTLRGSANLRARQQVDVLPKQGGVIARILVEEGTPVRQGQPLALLDDAEWRLQARQSSARAQAARDALERGRALQERGLLADQEVERLRSDGEVAAADAALAELRVQNATIVSPLNGVVTYRNIEQGQLVGANTVAFTVADLSRLEADVGVPEREATRVRTGQPARIRFEGSGSGAVGHVARIRPVVDPGSGTVQVTVEVDPQAELRAGQFVNIDIVTEILEERLALPRTAVLVDGPQPRIFRVAGGRAEEVTIELAGSHGERVEIRRGIEPGDTVVVVGQDNLRAGAGVLIMEVDGVPLADPEARLATGAGDPEAIEARLREGGMSPEEARAAAQGRRPEGGPPAGGRGPGGPGGGGGRPPAAFGPTGGGR